MERHFSYSALTRVFAGQAAQPEADAAVPHLVRCRSCWELAARVIAELKREDLLALSSDARGAVLTLLETEERQALNRLRARAAWAELHGLAGDEQLGRLNTRTSLQTQEMFDTLIAEASRLAQEDPYLGEETAFAAHALVDLLPESRLSEPFRNGLHSDAMLVIANCRRLAADWRGAAAALHAARAHLKRGTGEPLREARLLSIKASLASDTGHLEQALALLAQAAAIYQQEKDTASATSITIQEASALLAAGRHEEAVARAEEALRLLTPREARLEMLARSIITESLVFLGHPNEALRSLEATRPLYKRFWGRRTELQLGYLEALLLDSLGYVRESEKAFQDNIMSWLEDELYKDAFLTMLTRFENLFRRGELDTAAEACENALQLIEKAGAGCHSQMIELWRDLLALVNARRLTEHQLLVARQYLARHWNAPARRAPLRLQESPGVSALPRQDLNGNVAPTPQEQSRSSGLTAPRPELTGCLYEEALERYDRELIAAGLAQCGGRIRETSLLLGISRNTLRERMKRYGLRAEERADLSDRERTGSHHLRDEELQSLSRLRARAWWAELRGLSAGQQLDRIETVAALRTREIFARLVEEASSIAQNDPLRGEETARVAYALAGMLLLPESRCSEPVRNDLQSEALGVVANCRRLAGDWRGSAAALHATWGHLVRGTGEPTREARLLSLQASLAADTGHLEQALASLAQASAIYGKAQNSAAVASVTVQEASTLMAACRYEEAIGRAEDALRMLTSDEKRLEMLARNIITESLVFLGRPAEALRSFHSTRPLYEQLRGQRTELQLGYLEALLLESLGYARESEAVFRHNIAAWMEAELYKDAFLTMLTRFELLFRRGALDRAAQACEEAIERLEQAGKDFHSQMKEVWRDLLTLVEARRLTERELLAARHALSRSGKSPARGALLERCGGDLAPGAGDFELAGADFTGPATLAADSEFPALGEPTGLAPEDRDRRLLRVEPPAAVASLGEGDYQKAWQAYDRQLLAAALAQCHGQITETSRLLGISQTTLRAKMRRYGLTAEDFRGPKRS